MLFRFVLICPAELAFSCKCERVSSDPRSELTCLHVAGFAIAEPDCGGLAAALVLRGDADWVELLVLVPELHAARPTAQPATRIAAVIFAGPVDLSVTADLTCEFLFMRTCSPASDC